MRYHNFVEDLPDEQAQPWFVKSQGDFISIRQWDGTHEYVHWVLIPKDEIEEFLYELNKEFLSDD